MADGSGKIRLSFEQKFHALGVWFRAGINIFDFRSPPVSVWVAVIVVQKAKWSITQNGDAMGIARLLNSSNLTI
jgi:hypothetical protein